MMERTDMSTMLSDYFGETLGPVVSLILVVGLIALAGWIVWTIVRRVRSGLFIGGGAHGHAPRLAVIDAVPVDTQRRLVLVRRDDTEHLVMIGGPSDIVVESGIRRQQAAPRAQQPVAHAAPPSPPPASEPAQLPRTPAVAARDALIEAERGRPVRQPAPDVSDRRAMPPVAPPVVPPVVTPPAPPAPPAAQLPQPPVQAPAPAMRAEPQFSAEPPRPAAPEIDTGSAASKASADLDRILADLDLAKSNQR